MIISVTFSKPTKDAEAILGKPFEKIKIKAENSGGETKYFGEFFTKTQVTHKHFTEKELEDFLAQNIGKTFKNCVQRTDKQEILFLTNKKGKITRIAKDLAGSSNGSNGDNPAANGDNPLFKNKKYLLPEGSPVPFLVLLGLMTPEGKVIASKYDKFRQINRFLEFINDIIPEVQKLKSDDEEASPIRIADFGCGKSYLTFAVHYFLTEIMHIPCEIEGLDLKQDVINYCNEITKKLGLQNLFFHTGNIADYSNKQNPDIVGTSYKNSDVSTINYDITHDMPIYLFTQSELQFLIAEVQMRFGNNEAAAKTAYEAGVKADFDLRDTAGADAFLAGAGAFTGAQAEKLNLIYMQKWTALFMHDHMEAWSEIRRTDVPALSPHSAAEIKANSTIYKPGDLINPSVNKKGGSNIAMSMPYSSDSRKYNVNTPATARQITDKVFWDVK